MRSAARRRSVRSRLARRHGPSLRTGGFYPGGRGWPRHGRYVPRRGDRGPETISTRAVAQSARFRSRWRSLSPLPTRGWTHSAHAAQQRPHGSLAAPFMNHPMTGGAEGDEVVWSLAPPSARALMWCTSRKRALPAAGGATAMTVARQDLVAAPTAGWSARFLSPLRCTRASQSAVSRVSAAATGAGRVRLRSPHGHSPHTDGSTIW